LKQKLTIRNHGGKNEKETFCIFYDCWNDNSGFCAVDIIITTIMGTMV
jgi:hypothetical protein